MCMLCVIPHAKHDIVHIRELTEEPPVGSFIVLEACLTKVDSFQKKLTSHAKCVIDLGAKSPNNALDSLFDRLKTARGIITSNTKRLLAARPSIQNLEENCSLEEANQQLS